MTSGRFKSCRKDLCRRILVPSQRRVGGKMRRAFFGTGLARGLFATARGGDVAKTEQISQFFSSVSQHAVKVCEDVPCTGASLVPKVWTNPKVGSRPFSSFGEQALSSEEEVPKEDNVSMAAGHSANEAHGTEKGISGLIVEKYKEKMDGLKKKRSRFPVEDAESYEEWLEKHDATLRPLREFFNVHDIDAEWAIAELFKNGYWGKKLMRTLPDRQGHKADKADKAESISEDQYPWEKAVDLWSEALLAENLPHAPLDIIRRWPSLLCKTPDCLPGTVAVLRAAIPNEEALNETISSYPRVLVQSPVKLQHRVLALQMACGMDLAQILAKNPQMLYRNLDSIMRNIRYLRNYAWSLEHFGSLINYRPNILTMHPDVVQRNTQSSIDALKTAIGQDIDTKLIVQAKPQLILLPPTHIADRWDIISAYTLQVPEWQDELRDAVEDVANGTQGSRSIPKKEEDLHPVHTEFGVVSDTSVVPSTSEEPEEEVKADEWEKGEWGSTTLGSAIWAHPKRHQRLQFLVEVVGPKAGEVSFVDALTVHYHRFNHRYPDFEDWVRDQEFD